MATGSLGCKTLRLPRTNKMWNGGSTELHVMKSLEPSSCQSSARLFVRVPTDGANCCYQFFCLISEASAAQCEPVKRAIRRRWTGRLSDD